MKRTYTKVGKGYTREEIDTAISNVKWEAFRTDNLPFCQGSALNAVINQCNIPVKGISRMNLHGTIGNGYVGFYALDVKYANGQAQIYIADNGVNIAVVASDFIESC